MLACACAVSRKCQSIPCRDPAANVAVTEDAIETYPALSLFLRRSIEVYPNLNRSQANIDAIAEICRRLDGLPLAIELAAARSKLLTPTSMLSRIERRLPLLTGGARDLPVRQQTMRDTIAWTHDLLAPDERKFFRRLTVFAGGFNLIAAETICGDWPVNESGETIDVLSGIESLVDKNLLRPVDSAMRRSEEPRFAFLETIREFGLDQLTESGESPGSQAAAQRLGTRICGGDRSSSARNSRFSSISSTMSMKT